MKGIAWLASYPKSGNTWFRVFLANLLQKYEAPASINTLELTTIASTRGIFDDSVGIESSDLTMDEIERLRPQVYIHLAATADETLFLKAHDAYTHIDENTLLFPVQATFGAVYFIRNPLDVAVSFAHHLGVDYDTAISTMADGTCSFCDHHDRLPNQLRQRLLSWSGHVLSWTEAKIPTCVLKYEDMKNKPFKTFERAARFLGLKHGKSRIQKALSLSLFEELQRQEMVEGFREKSPKTKLFFRKGDVGSWREELIEEQVKQIINDHGEVMHRFGYLGGDGEIVY